MFFLTILSITVLYYKQVTTILSIAVCILRMILHSPPFFFNEYVLMLRLLGGYCLVAVNSSFCGCHHFWCYKSIKPPLSVQQGSLFIWVRVFHVTEVDICSSLFPTWRGIYPLHPPCLVLLTMTQFSEWSHQSQGPLSDGIYRQQHHSLSQMHVFPLMSTAMSCYLWSSPIFCGCSGGCPW